MPRTKNKPPRLDTIELRAATYERDDEALTDRMRNEERGCAARVNVTAPDGTTASAFLSVIYRDGRWRAEVSHDATDYNADDWDIKRASVPLTFYAPL